jgi:AhpC/TSA family
VSDDRFDDLGAERRAEIGDRLAERDRTHPEPRRPEMPRPGNKYAWAVGIVMLMVLGVVLFVQTLPNEGSGIDGPRRGSVIKAFAAPDARSGLDFDANLCQKPADCNPQIGTRPACDVPRAEGVVNVCDLREKPLVLTFIFDRGADCYPQVDRTERVMADLPEVNFATVFFTHKEPNEVRRLVEERRWRQPVALDRDGGVANIYGVGGCPTTVFTRAGGRVVATKLGNLTEAELREQARRL